MPSGISGWIRWWPGFGGWSSGSVGRRTRMAISTGPQDAARADANGCDPDQCGRSDPTCILESASSVTAEREQGTLDLLLSTPLQPKTYLDGKARSLLEARLPLLVAPCLFALGPALSRASLAAEVPVLLLLTIPSLCGFVLSVGLHQSVTSRTTIRATVVTIGLLILGLLPLHVIGGAVAQLWVQGLEVARAIAPLALIQTLGDRMLESPIPVEDTARISAVVGHRWAPFCGCS